MLDIRLQRIFNRIVKDFDLDYGNAGAEYFDREGRFIGYIEAPNNTTLTIDINFDVSKEMTDREIKDKFLSSIKEAIKDFDPEKVFEEVWHRGFEFSAFEFVDMLREDEEFFKTRLYGFLN